MAVDWIPVGSGFAIVFDHRGREAQRRPRQVRRIRVNGAYQPSQLHVAAGQPIRLIFRREETAACSERVVFPSLGVSADLPAFHEVAVDLPACEPGAHPFRCQMNVLHGNLIVEPNSTTSGAEARERTARVPSPPDRVDRPARTANRR